MRNIPAEYSIPFAAWDVRLYLDNHPTDKRALALYSQLCSQCRGMSNYACLPESEYDCDRWRWIDNPWPWEPEANNPSSARAGQCRCSVNRPQSNISPRRDK